MAKTENTITVTWALDAKAVRHARAAAALEGVGVQEYVSRCLTQCAERSGIPSDIHREPRAPYGEG